MSSIKTVDLNLLLEVYTHIISSGSEYKCAKLSLAYIQTVRYLTLRSAIQLTCTEQYVLLIA